MMLGKDCHVTRIGIRRNVRSLRQSASFFCEVLLATRLTNNRFRWGSVIFLLEEQADQASSGGMVGLAYRYNTVQVFKTDSEHRGLLMRGTEKGMAPVTLSDTARISFIKGPDNNQVEISQRASPTGDLEPG